MLRSWGPYRSSVWELHRQIKESAKFPCLLFASGSGFGYLMDVLSFLAYKKEMEEGELILQLNIHYTVRCEMFLSAYRFVKYTNCKSQLQRSFYNFIRFVHVIISNTVFQHFMPMHNILTLLNKTPSSQSSKSVWSF